MYIYKRHGVLVSQSLSFSHTQKHGVHTLYQFRTATTSIHSCRLKPSTDNTQNRNMVMPAMMMCGEEELELSRDGSHYSLSTGILPSLGARSNRRIKLRPFIVSPYDRHYRYFNLLCMSENNKNKNKSFFNHFFFKLVWLFVEHFLVLFSFLLF